MSLSALVSSKKSTPKKLNTFFFSYFTTDSFLPQCIMSWDTLKIWIQICISHNACWCITLRCLILKGIIHQLPHGSKSIASLKQFFSHFDKICQVKCHYFMHKKSNPVTVEGTTPHNHPFNTSVKRKKVTIIRRLSAELHEGRKQHLPETSDKSLQGVSPQDTRALVHDTNVTTQHGKGNEE